MNGQLLILALAAVAAGCVQAGLVPNNGVEYPNRMPAEGYSNFVQEPAYARDFYQELDHAPVQQQPQQPQTQPQPANGQAVAPGRRMVGHLRQLGKTGLDSTRRAYQEVKPTLNEIRGDLSQFGQRVLKDPRMQRVTNAVGPQLANAKSRAQPLLQRGKSFVERARTRHGQRNQPQAYEPGSVYPVPPPNAGQ